MILNCPKAVCQKDALICIYRCPMRVKSKCTEYFKHYEKIIALDIEKKYLEKYGDPIIVLPNAMRKRRKRRTKEQMRELRERQEVGDE